MGAVTGASNEGRGKKSLKEVKKEGPLFGRCDKTKGNKLVFAKIAIIQLCQL